MITMICITLAILIPTIAIWEYRAWEFHKFDKQISVEMVRLGYDPSKETIKTLAVKVGLTDLMSKTPNDLLNHLRGMK